MKQESKQSNNIDDLKELVLMYKNGYLSDEEFSSMKENLLKNNHSDKTSKK